MPPLTSAAVSHCLLTAAGTQCAASQPSAASDNHCWIFTHVSHEPVTGRLCPGDEQWAVSYILEWSCLQAGQGRAHMKYNARPSVCSDLVWEVHPRAARKTWNVPDMDFTWRTNSSHPVRSAHCRQNLYLCDIPTRAKATMDELWVHRVIMFVTWACNSLTSVCWDHGEVCVSFLVHPDSVVSQRKGIAAGGVHMKSAEQ